MTDTEKSASFRQYLAFLKSVGLILGAVALVWSARPGLFRPPAPDESPLVEKRLRTVWFGMTHYFVDHGAYPATHSPEAGPPTALTTPIAYAQALSRDPYSTSAPVIVARLDPSGQRPVHRTSLVFAALFAARMIWILLVPKRWAREKARRGADLWACALILSLWLAATQTLSPASLRLGVLCALGAGAFGLFSLRRLTQGALFLLGLLACGVVFCLLTEREVLLWAAAGAAGLAVVRTAVFYWTLGVRGAKGLLGYYGASMPGRGFLFPLCLYLTLCSCAAALILTQAHLNETEQIRALVRGPDPFACAARSDFFVVSSNGPDFRSEWRADVLFRLLDEEGPGAGEAYLRGRRYDPTNGARSRGDILLFAEGRRDSR
jgi:hypothetical protein